MTLDDVRNFRIDLQSASPKNSAKVGKEGKRGEVQKFEYLQNQRSFFIKIENIFRNFKYIMGHTDIWRQKLRLFRELDISFTLIKRCFSMMHISNKSGFAKFFHWYNAYFSKYDYCADWLCKRIYFQDLITTKFWLE